VQRRDRRKGRDGDEVMLTTVVSVPPPFTRKKSHDFFKEETQMTTSHQKEQAERRSLVGSTGGMTLHSQAITQIELEGQGRHAAAARASVVGKERVPLYPRQGPDSPWSNDLSGVEPPLGIDLEYVEPCGTPVEVAASLSIPLADAAMATAVVDAPAGAETPLAVSPSPAGGVSLLRGRRL
jgi:hypothetical protein